MNDFVCPCCGYKHKDHISTFGKVCLKCGNVVETSKMLRKQLYDNFKETQTEILKYLKDKFGDKNAN